MEGVDGRAIGGRRVPVAAPDAAARAAGELAGGRRRAVEDPRDVRERDREDVVQDEREPLGRRELLEDDEQRGADGVGGDRLALGVGRRARGCGDDRVGEPAGVQLLLAPAAARVEHAQADARDDRRQPAAHVLDLAGVRAVDADPRLLEGVVGLGARAEDPGGHGVQVGSVLFEWVHVRSCHIVANRWVNQMTRAKPAM